MRRRLALAATVAVVVLVVWAFYRLAETASRGGQSNPLYSSLRYDPYGTAALRELLIERDVLFRTLERPHLEEDDRGTLIQVLPLRPGPSLFGLLGGGGPQAASPSAEELAEWVAEGNTVVQLTRDSTPLMARLQRGLTLEEVADLLARTHEEGSDWRPAARELEEDQKKGLAPDDLGWPLLAASWTGAARDLLGDRAAAARPLKLRCPGELESGQAGEWRPVAETAAGRVVAAEIAHGEGRLIVVAAPTPALNHALGEGGNLDFLLALAGEGPVILDEWAHGIGHKGTVLGLIRRFGLLPVLGQVVLVLALYVWSTRGHPRPPSDQPLRRRSVVEQVQTLGFLYRRTLSPEETARRVRREALRRLADGLHCSPEELEAGSAKLPPQEARQVAAVREALELRPRGRRAARWDARLARVLSLSHQFCEEKTHGRRRA
ncbi:MAG: hypothetical protein ACLF0G_00075 [Candidatus Brocadiia bacterium]